MTAQSINHGTIEVLPQAPVGQSEPTDKGLLCLRVEYRPVGIATVRVGGEVDLLSAPRLHELLKSRLHSKLDNVVLDLTDVSFMSVAGAQVLSQVATYAADSGTAFGIVADGSRAVRRVLRATGLRERLPLYEVS